MEYFSTILSMLATGVVILSIIYFVIKIAVKNAIKELKEEKIL